MINSSNNIMAIVLWLSTGEMNYMGNFIKIESKLRTKYIAAFHISISEEEAITCSFSLAKYYL